MHLKLLPVHSKIADRDEYKKDYPELDHAVPKDWDLSQHQVETFKALGNPDIDVVINTAMTGDGKSLAGQLHTLVDGWSMMALYPTNELLVDQALNLDSTLERWKKRVNYEELFGARLDQQIETSQQRRSDEVRATLANNKVILSNPDIWHLALQSVYRGGGAPTLIASEMRDKFSLFTFDEFHLYNQPQIGAVLSGLLFMLASTGFPVKTLLLSATPSPLFQKAFEKLGWQDRIKLVQGSYRYGENPDPQTWRTILQPVDLHCHKAIPREHGGIEQWMATEGKERLLKFFADQPFVKGAIIVNSVASAKRILDLVREPLATIGKTAETCTGLDSTVIRAKARNADVLIGTATVDVGVDFQINFLIFEASDAGNAIQRLGRIGRHTHYTDENKQRHAFEQFEAHAIMPNFIYQRLFEAHDNAPACFQADPQAVERGVLNDAIRYAFPDPQTFDRYLSKWGRFQPARVLSVLSDKAIAASFAQTRETLRNQYTHVFRAGIGKTVNEAQQAKGTPFMELVREACSFRGGSPFQCGVINETKRGDDTLPSIVGYDLFWLLANTNCEWISEAEFRKHAPNPEPFLRGFHIGFVRVRGILTERRSLKIDLDMADCDWQQPKTAQAIRGVRVYPDGMDTNWINRELIKIPVAAWFVEGATPETIRQKGYLPGNFTLYYFEHHNNQGTVAFGRDALLLDSLSDKFKHVGTMPAAYFL